MKEREEKDKSKLSIRLAEPVIYLKDVDFSGRRYTHNEFSPPSMVRGILVLNLHKPTKICSIGIELTAQSSTRWPEGAGARRVEVTEEHELYSSSTVYFRQGAEGHPSRRAISLGPPSSRAATEEDDASSSDLEADHEERGGSHAQPLGTRRGASFDLQNFHRESISQVTTTRIFTPGSIAEKTPDGSPTSSAASLSTTQLTPPRGSPPPSGASSRIHSNPPPVQRDHPLTISGTSGVPALASRRRPAQVPEDSQRALRLDPPSRQTPPQTDANNLTSLTPSPLPHGLPNETPGRFSSSRSSAESNDRTHGRRRSKSRFSFSAISDAILDSVRSRSPLPAKRRTEGTSVGLDAQDGGEKIGELSRGRSREKGKGVTRDLSNALIKVSEVLGLEPEDGKEPRDGWKEFKKGTYKYPISFAIPADSPPSLDCMFGSVVWTLTATVHRPGMFTPRMETTRTIDVIATPSDDATEDVESVTVNKVWEDQMVYSLSIVGRAFPIGSKIPIQLTILPLAKIKIHKVSVVIDEKIIYYSQMQKVAKVPKATRQVLRCLKHPSRGRSPILPLAEEDFRESPLYALAREDLEYCGQREEERALELAADWMGPGPWPLRFNVEILNNLGFLRPTTMNKKGNITVSHTLGVVIRVEKGDTVEGDGDGLKKKKMFDITIQYPIHLLSHLCNQKYTLLPPYSQTWYTVPLQSGRPSYSEAGPSIIAREVSPAEFENSARESAVPTNPAQNATVKEREQLTLEFERLVAGQEAETGEPPPSYHSTTHPTHVIHPPPLHS